MINRIVRSIFVLLAVVAPMLTTQGTANAWSGDLPDCGTIPDYVAAISADTAYDAGKTSYVVFERVWTGNPLNGSVGVAVDWDVTDDVASNTVLFDYGDGTHGLSTNDLRKLNTDNTLSGTVSGGISMDDIACIAAVHDASPGAANSIYASSYTGSTDYHDPADGDGDPDPIYNECATLDFVCYYGNVMTFFGIVGSFIGDFFTSIGSLFEDFSVGLAEMLGGLFIPTDNHFSDTFNALNTFFQDKFGFLSWPLTFLGDLITALSVASNASHCVPGSGGSISAFCEISLAAPGGVIPQFKINFGVIEQSWPTLWTYLQTAIVGVTMFGLITAIYHKYMRIIKS